LFAKSCLSEVVPLLTGDVGGVLWVVQWVGCNQVPLSVAGLHVLHVLLMFACAQPHPHPRQHPHLGTGCRDLGLSPRLGKSINLKAIAVNVQRLFGSCQKFAHTLTE